MMFLLDYLSLKINRQITQAIEKKITTSACVGVYPAPNSFERRNDPRRHSEVLNDKRHETAYIKLSQTFYAN